MLLNNIRNYRSVFVLIILVLFIVCVGCGQDKTRKNNIQQQGYVTDYKGNKIKIPENPQKIVSLSVSSDEILLELVSAERIAGITNSIDRIELSNNVLKAKKIKGRVNPSSPESIIKLQPDLVIIPDFVRPEVINTLKDTGLTVYVYRKQNSFEEVKESIRKIANLVKQDPKMLLDYMERKELYLSQKLSGLKKKKRCVFLMATGVYSNPNSIFQDMCNKAGLVDCSFEINKGKKASLSKEQLVKLDPDIIIVPDFNWDGKTDTNVKIRNIVEDDAYKNIKAIKNKQVIAVNGAHLYSLSHHVVDAAEDIAKGAYPELFR